MSYTPINIAAFVAAYSGAISGMAVNGWISKENPDHYTAATNIAGIFAQAFDTIWDNADPLNSLELSSITSIVSADFSLRGPGPLENPLFQRIENWEQAAKACAALVLESDAYFAGEGINPGTGGGGGVQTVFGRPGPNIIAEPNDYSADLVSTAVLGGPDVDTSLSALEGLVGVAQGTANGAMLPFKGVYYVDPTWGGANTGSQSNPFTTIADAFAFALSVGVTDAIIYTRDIAENVVFPTTGNWALIGFREGYVKQVTITGTLDLSFAGVNRDLFLQNLHVTGAISGNLAAPGFVSFVRVLGCAFDNSINLTAPTARPWRLYFGGDTGPGSSTTGFAGYVLGPITIKGTLNGSNYSFTGLINVTADTGNAEIILSNSIATGGLTITANQAGVIAIIVLVNNSNINNTTVTFAGIGINVFQADLRSATNMSQHGAAIVPALPAVLAATTSNTNGRIAGSTNNRGPIQLSAKSPFILMEIRATILLRTPGTSGNLVLNVIYTDMLNVVRTKPVTAPLNIAGAAGDEVQGTFLFTQNGTAPISWSTSGVVTAGTLVYDTTVSVMPAY